jgi:hypothetical protein
MREWLEFLRLCAHVRERGGERTWWNARVEDAFLITIAYRYPRFLMHCLQIYVAVPLIGYCAKSLDLSVICSIPIILTHVNTWNTFQAPHAS